MFQNFLSPLSQSSCQEPHASDPALRVMFTCSVFILGLTSLCMIISCLFAWKRGLKQVLGPFTLFYSFSCLCLAVCWFLSSNSSASEPPNPFVAFFTVCSIYFCIFGKIGVTWYFWRYLEDKTADVALQGISIRSRARQQEGRPTLAPKERPLIKETDFPEVPQTLITQYNLAMQECNDMEKRNSRSENNDKKLMQRLKKIEKLVKGSPLSQINLIIICGVLIATLCVTVTYAFYQALGKGFFGDWSVEWADKVQIPGIVVCVFTLLIDLGMSVLTLIYYHRENFSGRAKELRDKQRDDLNEEETQEKHYLSYLFPFIVVMTFLNSMLLIAILWANQATAPDCGYGVWKNAYVFSPAFQSFSLFLLKITERRPSPPKKNPPEGLPLQEPDGM